MNLKQPIFEKENKMKRLIFVLTFFAASSVIAEERLKVAIPSEDEAQVQKFLEKMKDAVNNEDYKAYLSCLTKELASKTKKKTAAMFLQHDMNMELQGFSIVESDDNVIEFVAKYTLDFGDSSNTFVSSIKATRSEDSLLLSNEEIISKNNNKENNQIASNQQMVFCPDGNCPLPNRQGNVGPFQGNVGPFQGNVENEPKEDKRFIRIDPNGPMWLDPMVLVRTFPEKYPPSCGGKCEKDIDFRNK